jgi:16S rRNA (guanine527-N7)-methyltransferase
MREVRERLVALGGHFALPPSSLARFERLVVDLAADQRAPTAVTDPDRVVDVHLADSLAGLQVGGLRELERIVDIGSGAGFPGLALALAMPEARFDLLEASSRKCAFLERLAVTLETDNVRVICQRAEHWAMGEGAEAYTGAVSRAVGSLATLIEYAAPLLELGGQLYVWKGRRDAAQERAATGAGAVLGMRSLGVEWVGPFAGSRNRHIHRYGKVSACPPGFPRRPGMARKRPLGERNREPY